LKNNYDRITLGEFFIFVLELLASVEVHPYASYYCNNVSSLYSDLNRIVRGSILSLIDRKSPK